MSGILLPGDLRKRLADQQAEQAAIRSTDRLTGAWSVDELAALSRLAWDLFGDQGLIEFRQGHAGIAFVGVAHLRKAQPGAYRYRPAEWLFSGRTLAEIHAQVAEWKARR